MKCPQCQAENPDDAQYCYLCYARFRVRERSSEAEEKARRIREGNEGARLRCPNCGELSPVESPFCLRCGFVFEDPESLLVPEEEVESYLEKRVSRERQEDEVLHTHPIVVDGAVEGAEVMRRIEDALESGYRAHVQARGRHAIAHAMKLFALLGEEMERRGKELVLRVRLQDDQVVKDLEDLALDLETQLLDRSGGQG